MIVLQAQVRGTTTYIVDSGWFVYVNGEIFNFLSLKPLDGESVYIGTGNVGKSLSH